ncbi:MAG: 6-phosphogluconolactonase [Rhodobacter sp.]|nr:6-phosphogluconolactonase [Rhodobacter sp.]
MKLIEYPDQDMMMIDVANHLAGELADCVMNHDHASFAVPGGTTPGPIFDVLCAADFDWSRVHVFLTDERWVPEDHERSNTGLIRDRLLVGRAAAAHFVPLYAEAERPEDKLADLATAFEGEFPISVLLLGMGTDMHTASLFPYAEGLEAALADDAPPLMVMRPAGQPEPRVTLTAPVLRAAMSTHLVITGTEKRRALDRAAALQDPMEAPVSAILPGATVHWAE